MKRTRGASENDQRLIELKSLWDKRNEALLDLCASAALYAEAIEHREGSDGGVRFLMRTCHWSEIDARDAIQIGRNIVGHIKVPRHEWDSARESTAMPIIERLEARLAAGGRNPSAATGGRSRPAPS